MGCYAIKIHKKEKQQQQEITYLNEKKRKRLGNIGVFFTWFWSRNREKDEKIKCFCGVLMGFVLYARKQKKKDREEKGIFGTYFHF